MAIRIWNRTEALFLLPPPWSVTVEANGWRTVDGTEAEVVERLTGDSTDTADDWPERLRLDTVDDSLIDTWFVTPEEDLILVRVASAAALPANTRTGDVLEADASGALNDTGIDAITDLAVGEIVLIKDEGTGANNGAFEIEDLGSAGTPWSMRRILEMNVDVQVRGGMTFRVVEGTANGGQEWYLSNTGAIIVNTTALTFANLGSAMGPITSTLTDAATSTVGDVVTMVHDTSGTPVAGFGTGLLFQGDDSANNNEDMGRISAVWETPTHTSEGTALVFETRTGGGALTEHMRLSEAGDLSIVDGGGLIVGGATQVAGSSTSELQVLGTAAADSSSILGRWSADALGPIASFVKSRNATIGSFTTVNDDDTVGTIEWLPDDATDYATTAATFAAEVDDATPATGDIGMAFVWASMAGGGAAIAERMRMSAAGDLSIADTGGLIVGNETQITGTSAAEAQVLGTGAADSSALVGRWSADALAPSVQFVKSRNAAIGSFTIVQDDDVIGLLDFLPDDATDYATQAATFSCEVDDGSPATGDIGTAFVWSQMPGAAGALRETMRLSAAGDLSIPDTGGVIIGNETQITGSSTSELQVLGTAAADSSTIAGRWSADALGPLHSFVKSRNAAIGSFTVINDDDVIGTIEWLPDDGTDYATSAATFHAEVDDAGPGTGDIGMAFVWSQMAAAVALRETMRLSAAGDLSIADGGGVIIGGEAQVAGSSTSELQVLGTGAPDSSSIHGRWSADAVGPIASFMKSRNATIGTLTIVQDNDVVGSLEWLPDDGADFATTAALFFAEVDDATPLAGDIGMAFVWSSMPGAAGALRETMRLSAAGDLLVANDGGLVVGAPAQITGSSISEFQVLGTAGVDSSSIHGRWSADALGPTASFVKGRNAAIGAHTIVQDNDIVGSIEWLPDDGADFATTAALFFAEVEDATPAAGDVGMAFVWQQMPGGGGAIAETMRLAADGTLTVLTAIDVPAIGSTTPGSGAFTTIGASADVTIADGAGLIIGNAAQIAGSSTSEMQVLGTAGADSSSIVGRWSADALGPIASFVKSRNAAIGSFAIAQDDDVIGTLEWLPDDGVDYATSAATFHAEVDDAGPGAGDIGMAFVWSQMAAGVALRETMRLSAAGDLSIADGGAILVGNETQITGTSAAEFQVLGTAAADSSGMLGRWSADAAEATLQFVKSRNAAIGSNTIVVDDDLVGSVEFLPDDGVGFATLAARIYAEVDDATPAAGDVGMAFVWEQMPGGAGALRETMRLSAGGDLTVATGDVIVADGGGVIVGNATQVTGSALSELQVLGTAAVDSSTIVGRWSADALGPVASFIKSRNATIGTSTIVQDDDVIGTLEWLPDDNVDFATTAATFHVEVDDGTPTTSDIGMAFVWASMAGGGAAIAERMRLSAAGDLSIADTGGLIIGNETQVAGSSTSEFQVLGTASPDSSTIVGRWSADAIGPVASFVKSRNGTIGSSTIVVDDDVIGSLEFLPDDGADFATTAATFHAEVDDGSPAAGDIGMAFVWSQMPGGAGALAETMRLSAAGALTVHNALLETQGTDIASANDIDTIEDGNYFDITGAVQINRIGAGNYVAGASIVLKFDGAPIITHNTAAGGGFQPILFNNGIDHTMVAGDILVLRYDGANWREVTGTPLDGVLHRENLAADSQLTGDGMGATTETIHTAITIPQEILGGLRRVIYFHAELYVDSDNAADTWTFRVRIDGLTGTLLVTSGAHNIAAGDHVQIIGELQIRATGGGGNMGAHVHMTGDTVVAVDVNTYTPAAAVDTTADRTLVITGECSTNNAGNQVTLRNFEVICREA